MTRLPEWEKYLYFKKKAVYKSSTGEYGAFKQHEIIRAAVVLDTDIDIPKLLADGSIFWCNDIGERLSTEKTKPATPSGSTDSTTKKKSKPKSVKIRFLKDLKLAETSFKKGDVESFDEKGAEHLIERKIAVRVGRHPREIEAEQKKELEKAEIEEYKRLRNKLAMDELGEQLNEVMHRSEPTPEEKKERLTILKHTKLLVNTVKEIQKEVSGEEDTIAAEIITTSTRLVKNAIPESTNLLLSDKTGLGKDHVTKKTLEVVIPKDDLLHITKMTPEGFTYWHYKDEGWTWNNKVIHFEDVTQQLLNCPTFKIMSSGGSYAVVVKDQKTIEIPIPGKPCMILTSHHANPRDESLRRFRIGALNDTDDQTRAIKDKISSQYTGNKKTTPDFVLRKAVQSLEPYPVIIPYAELIQHFFPDDSLMRTHYHCFLDYICGSAIFHQYQREKTDSGDIIATPDDYMIARMVLIYTTSNPKMIPMSREYRDIIEILKDNVEGMTVKEIDIKCSQSRPWLYKHLPNLVATGLVVKGKIHNDSANKDVITYKYADVNPNAIPTWEGICSKIEDIVNKTNKTNKTTQDSLLENWFSTHDIKPIKPKDGKEGFSLVLYGHIIPLNGKVLLVFSVFSAFLRERDNKRYKKYYDEPEATEGRVEGVEGVTPKSTKTKDIDFFDKTNDLTEENRLDDMTLLCEVRDIMKTRPRFQWAINDIVFKVGLAGSQACDKIKELLDNELMANPEKSWIVKHDGSGLYWGYQEVK